MTDSSSHSEPTSSAAAPLRLTRIAAICALSAVVFTPLVSSPPAGAQAQPVLVTVRSTPPRPIPGDDVAITASIEGCPLGQSTAEVYLETDDGAQRNATLVATANATTTVLLRTSATVQVPAAVEGWYGVRVLCGTFRPPRHSMANTLTRVRPLEPTEFDVVEPELSLGQTPTLAGNGCTNAIVEYMYQGGIALNAPFEATGIIATGEGPTWAGPAPWPDQMLAGPLLIRARCVHGAGTAESRTVAFPTVSNRTVGP